MIKIIDEIKKITCPDCKLLMCSEVCLRRTQIMSLQKLLYKIMMGDRARIKRTLARIDTDQLLEQITKEPDTLKMFVATLLAVVDDKMKE